MSDAKRWYFGSYCGEVLALNLTDDQSISEDEPHDFVLGTDYDAIKAENEVMAKRLLLVDIVHGAKAEMRWTALVNENKSLRKDAEFGRIALKYFDRMDDPADCDPLEKSVSEFLAKIRAAISSPENPS